MFIDDHGDHKEIPAASPDLGLTTSWLFRSTNWRLNRDFYCSDNHGDYFDDDHCDYNDDHHGDYYCSDDHGDYYCIGDPGDYYCSDDDEEHNGDSVITP